MDVPTESQTWISIHFARIGKPTRIFKDGFIEDDGSRLKTFSKLSPEISEELSGGFQAEGLLYPGQQITGVEKCLFYKEYFSIMQIVDHEMQVLGIYTDIATPLHRVGEQYHLTDLCLDLWLGTDGRILILDEEEFEQACEDGLLEPRLAQTARFTLKRLLAEAQAGIFPNRYPR